MIWKWQRTISLLPIVLGKDNTLMLTGLNSLEGTAWRKKASCCPWRRKLPCCERVQKGATCKEGTAEQHAGDRKKAGPSVLQLQRTKFCQWPCELGRGSESQKEVQPIWPDGSLVTPWAEDPEIPNSQASRRSNVGGYYTAGQRHSIWGEIYVWFKSSFCQGSFSFILPRNFQQKFRPSFY